jgi:protein-disulfide isomerase
LFVDPQCAICRTTTPGVEAAAAAAGMPLREHLLTGLGAASEVAARAMLAARVQGREAEMRMRLSRAALVTNAAYVEAVAREIGVDPLRLARDMMSPEVDAELDQAARLAASFGISGTPAMVIGRTVVIGAMRRAEVAALIDMERAEVAPGPCG